MKKILFATTALIATAGVAAADVTFGGYGRFGLGYVEDRDVNTRTPNASDTVIVSRFRINIDASVESDSGATFSARIRMQADDSEDGEANSAALNGARFSVEYSGLRVDVGNTAGAIDNAPNYYGAEPGLQNFLGQYSGNDYSFLGYATGATGANAVYARYEIGDFAVAASYDSSLTGADRWDIHAAYTFGNITAALAHGQTDNATDDDMTVLTLNGNLGPVNATLFVGDESVGNNAAVSDTFYGISAEYELSSATTLNFAYGDGSGDGDTRHVGFGAVHDLGGGVSLRGGIGSIKPTSASNAITAADFGVRFNF